MQFYQRNGWAGSNPHAHPEKPASAGNGPIKNRRLYRQLQNIEKLPKRDQQAVLRTIDAFLAKAS